MLVFPAVLFSLASALAAQSLEERLRNLEAQVAALQQQLAAAQATSSPQHVQELERQLQVLAEELARLRHGEAVAPVQLPRALGLAPAASKVYAAAFGVSLGGYGEVLYQNFASRQEDGRPAGKVDSADALRYVLYAGYKFDDRFLFNSEVELEHAHTGKGGEVELEFAYVDWLHTGTFNFRAGMILVPLGLLNEVHEPTTFWPARRSETESRLIPTTWRELGLGAHGDVGPLSYRASLLTALDASKFSARGLRDSRQAGAKAKAETLAWAGRLDWTATPGLLAGLGAYYGQSGQGLKTVEGRALDVPATILEAHGEWKPGRWTVRALWAEARVGQAADLNRRLGLSASAAVGERLAGGYLELGYDLLPSERRVLAPVVRFERLDTQRRVPPSFGRNPSNDEEILTLGVAFQPIPNLVFKADWQDVSNRGRRGVRQWNLALG